jgi:hypothetical protein
VVRAEYHIAVAGSRYLLVAMVGAILVACGGAAAPPRITDGSVPVASRVTVLDAPTLARDAIDPGGLLALLDDAGFVAATERVGADRPGGLDRVVVRAVAFGSPDGADAYLGWLRSHVADVIGPAETLASLRPGGGDVVPLFRHEPGDCCPKATVAYLAGWRDGSVAVTLEMAGRNVDADVFAATADDVEIGEV